VVMPLGPDRAPGESESEEEVALGANGLPRKVYKKKGLKRQTRKTNIKPVLHKPKKAADLEEKAESDDEEAVGETQLDGTESNSVQDARQENTDKDAEKIKKVAQKVSQNFRKMNIKSHQTSKQKAAKSRGRFGKR
jgi:DNA replication regulator SLD2